MDKEQQELEMKRMKERERIAAVSFHQERETSLKKSYTSFGKLILAEEKASPMYSIGTARRFAPANGMPGFEKNTPGPQYNPPDVSKYKFNANRQGTIGKGKRPPLDDNEKYAYYTLLYHKLNDLERLPKKWKNIEGGGLPLESRIKYDLREKVPGPGRYEINLKLIKSKAPTYYIGEKIHPSSLKTNTGTNELVGPSTYRVESAKISSRNKLFPIYTIPKGKRHGINNMNWALHETYFDYSACGNQIMTRKRSEPIINIGKATRNHEKKRGQFPCMMDRRPQSVRIPMPKL